MRDSEKHERRLLINIAERIINFSKQLDEGKVKLEYQYAMMLSQLQKDAGHVLAGRQDDGL